MSISPDEPDYFIAYEGHKLSRSAAGELEKLLELDPDNWEARFKLLGYYSRHYYCCEGASNHRLEHIVWLIGKAPDFNHSLTPLMYFHLLDRDGYAAIKPILQSTATLFADNVEVSRNIASLVRPQDPEWAEQLLERAIRLDSNNADLSDQLASLRDSMPMLVSNRASFENSTDPLVYKELCSHNQT